MKSMKRMFALLLALAVLCAASTALAAGSPDDAKAMVGKAVAFYKANGKDKAFASINNPTGEFVKGDIYVFVFDTKGTCLAHGNNAKLVGKDMLESKDADGKEFIKEFVKIGPAGGWVEYKWSNPETKKIQGKKAWLINVDGHLFGSGAYK